MDLAFLEINCEVTNFFLFFVKNFNFDQFLKNHKFQKFANFGIKIKRNVDSFVLIFEENIPIKDFP